MQTEIVISVAACGSTNEVGLTLCVCVFLHVLAVTENLNILSYASISARTDLTLSSHSTDCKWL